MRELVVLGTSSQVPTRTRNHNGYFLSWDGEGILFDPGDGTQRQMSLAGVSATDITRICVTHFHGDHCLGLPGVIQRISLDSAPHPVTAHFPASGQVFFDRLRHASVFYDAADIRPDPVTNDGFIATSPKWSLEARRLDHGIDTYGYRLVEADGRRMVPELLGQHGVSGPAVGILQRDGAVTVDGRTVTVEAVSVPRPGQRFAFVMDTRLCEGVFALAAGADLLVIESTYLDVDAGLAAAHGHLTAGQAARVAAESGVRTLVLTHFSQRYDDPTRFAEEAAKAFDGEVVVAEDLTRIRVPARRP
ncbi:ribonuclease Z [Dactylosporangium sp. NPDC049525]|uniref:ribonuclease Z n=1 Tax=Dactylosporangium sp. NPDC049525 TaxID=3154730 RepID=UPI0034469D2F